ncbi:MAG: kelch repeat-containing protein [Thermomicrobiales bacterium]
MGGCCWSGGLAAGPWSNTTAAELYDAEAKSWSSAAPALTARTNHTATMLPDGSILVVGGMKPVCCGGMASAERYVPGKNAWFPAWPMATERANHTATLLNNGKVLVVGGYTQGNTPNAPGTIHASAELYDPATNSWSPAASLATPRTQHTATRLADGTVLVVGGAGPNGTMYSAERYDPVANSWNPAGTLTNAPRTGHTATLLQDNTVLVIGGDKQKSAERYNPATNSWSGAGSLVGPRGGHSATLTTTGEVLVAGGWGAGGTLATSERYYPATNSWIQGSNMAAGRGDHAAVLVGGMILVVGGRDSNGTPQKSAEWYNDGPPGRCFAETGQCINGDFFTYYNAHGGLAINGYPLSGAFPERLEDGQVYLVQYFERVRMEYHPENAAPYTVLLGQFGRQIHGGADPAATPLQGARYFKETGHNLVGNLLVYWDEHGGLTQFGYPISEEFDEVLEDGQTYQVQYFERARFERHPENNLEYYVLLGQFGRQVLAGR